MKKKYFGIAGMAVLLSLLAACNRNPLPAAESETVSETVSEIQAGSENAQDSSAAEVTSESSTEKGMNACELEDGIYLAEFSTDGSMFHVNEMCDGKGELTVENGKMIIHISLPSKSILNLYPGLAEDAQKDGAILLEPTTDVVEYDDGTSEEVHGFDIPVPKLDEEFYVALIGTKGKWYDHKVIVSNPVLKEESGSDQSVSTEENAQKGDCSIELELQGGSGKAGITSPALVRETDDGYVLVVEWSSPNYDYMLVGGEKYLPVNEDGNSVFEIPVESFDSPLEVIADTIAMSKPHEIEYTIVFAKDTLKEIK